MITRHLKRNAGMSLIEVLVSMILLSVALLGTAKLTSASLKSTNTAYHRSHATFLADDMLDRMRANATAARNGQYNIDTDSNMSASSGSFAEADCTEWLANIADALPAGKGIVAITGNALTTITIRITIEWDGDNSFATESQL